MFLWRLVKSNQVIEEVAQIIMKIKVTMLSLILILIPMSIFSAADNSHQSKYAGEEKREIKSLSETDIEELKTGKKLS